MSVRNWLIEKLGGYTKKQLLEETAIIKRRTFFEEVEMRVRNGKTCAVVSTLPFELALQKFERMFSIKLSEMPNVVIKKLLVNSVTFNGLTYVFFNRNEAERIRGFSLFGYIYLKEEQDER